jgi:DNA-binding FadR family transcriptional regulator
MSVEFSPARRRPVQDAAEALRELVFAADPETRIGALPDLARALGVGITTVQQAARILEHEGLLEVRRGPGGGYYGRRPDAAALERALAAWMRMHPASYGEALDLTSLLFNELAAAAARCRDQALHDALARLRASMDAESSANERLAFEAEFEDLLFRMVDRPLFELLTRVTMTLSLGRKNAEESGVISPEWWDGRARIVDAVLRRDPELARFEADRSNRRHVLAMAEREKAPPNGNHPTGG